VNTVVRSFRFTVLQFTAPTPQRLYYLPMIAITRAEVPEYLRNGEFYSSLSPAEEEIFELPANVLKPNLELHGVCDLEYLLQSLRFWMVASPPTELLEYCLSTCTAREEETKETLERYANELPYVKFLLWNLGSNRSTVDQVREALRAGDLSILEYLHRRSQSLSSTVRFAACDFSCAVEGGSVECLAFILSKGCPISVGMRLCARNKALLTYLLDHCPSCKPDFNAYVERGMVDLVQCLLSRGYTWTPRTLATCLKKNSLSMLKYLHEQGCNEWAEVTTLAYRMGNLEILQYAHENGAPWEPDTMMMFCCDNYECMVYAHQHGCPWHSNTLFSEVSANRVPPDWRCFDYALENGCPCPFRVAAEMAVHSLEKLQNMRLRGFPCNLNECLHRTIWSANLDVVRFLRSEGAVWSEDALLHIVGCCDDTSILEYAYHDGLPFDSPKACANAAGRFPFGDLGFWRFLHEHGCPCDHTAVESAKTSRASECLEYLLQHGCPAGP
jgi:hypothetical protein